MTTLQHTECLRQIYNKMRLTKNRTRKLQQKLRQNVRHLISCHTTHQARIQ